MKTRFIESAIAICLTLSGACHALAQEYTLGSLVILHPHARATPPNAPVSGGFLTIRNTGAQADRLISGSAGFAEKLEVHEMAMEGDVMKMRPVAGGLEIPAGGEVELKPGGYHVMFTGIDAQLKAGETRKAKLVFEKAGEIEIEFKVEEMQPGEHKLQGG